jgi:hypothetical protein
MSPDPPASQSLKEQIASSAPLIEATWKLSLFGSVLLYTLGLVISNYRLQVLGRPSLDLARAEYVLVGLLWAMLSLIGYALWRSVRTIFKDEVPNVPKIKHPLARLVGSLLGAAILGVFFGSVTVVLGVGSALSKVSWIVYFYTLCTGAAIDFLVRHTAAVHAAQPISFSIFLESPYFVNLATRGLPFAGTIFIYATVIFPLIPLGIGGGKLQRAELLIRTDHKESLAKMGVAIDEAGSGGIWSIVTELPDGFVITNDDRPPEQQRVTLWVRKEAIEVLRYVAYSSPP